jgi:outer membrane receptor protein involved in Fe transport
VNLVTRKSMDSSQITLSGGSHSTWRLLAVGSAGSERVHPWFAAEAYGTQGPFLHGEDLQRYNLFGKVSYDLTPNTTVSALGLVYGSGWRGSGQIPARLVDAGFLDRYGAIDPTEGGDTQRQQLILALQIRPDKDSSFTATASALRYGLTLFNNFTFQLHNPVDGDQIEQDDRRTSLFAQLKYERTDRGLWPGLLVSTIGAQVRSDDIDASLWKARQRVRLADCDQALNPCTDTNARTTDATMYLQLDYRPFDKLRIIAGLRGDLFLFDVRPNNGGGITPGQPQAPPPSVQQSIVSPKASAVVSATPDLDLFLNYGRGFHSNDARGVVQAGGAGALPAATGAEIGARARLLGGRLDLAGAAWLLDLQSELVWNGDEGGTSPSGATRRIGIDLEARYQILPWLTADLDASFARAQYKTDSGNGNAVALAPPRIITGGLSARHPSGFSASLRLRHIGPRPATQLTQADGVPLCTPALDASTEAGQRCYLVADGYTVLDATVGWQTKRWAVSLLVENLTNSVFREAQFGNVSQVISPPDGHAASTSGLPWVPETHPVQDIHFTPGNPIGALVSATLFF